MLQIVPAVPKLHFEEVHQLMKSNFKDLRSSTLFDTHQLLVMSEGISHVAVEQSGIVVGFRIGVLPVGSKRVVPMGVAVADSVRRQGVASRLFEATEAAAKHLGADEWQVTVSPRNTASILLHEKMGYEYVRLEVPYAGQPEGRIIMSKKL